MSVFGNDWQSATFPVMGEADLARWLRAAGTVVVERHGRYWQQVVPGFYQPLHFLARFNSPDVTCPRTLCWGMRAVLTEASASHANASLPAYVLPDLAGYTLSRLDGRRRHAINKAGRSVDVVVLDRPDVLLEQGPPLLREAAARNSRNLGITDTAFRSWVAAGFAGGCRPVFLAMLRSGELLGFSVGFAIDGIAYYHQHYIAERARNLNLDRLSFHAKALMAQRTPGIHTLVNGLHVPESAGLSAFKASQGLVVAEYPSLARIQPLIGRLLRRHRPYQYYRLTGRHPAAASSAAVADPGEPVAHHH
jgi:hypothetical protein